MPRRHQMYSVYIPTYISSFFSPFLKEFTTSSSFDSQKQMKLLQDCQKRTNPGFVPAEILFLGAILFTAACLNAERDTERERIQNGCCPRLSHRVFAVFDGPLQEAGETALHYSVRTADQTSLHLVDFLVQNRYFSKSFSPSKKKARKSCKIVWIVVGFSCTSNSCEDFFFQTRHQFRGKSSSKQQFLLKSSASDLICLSAASLSSPVLQSAVQQQTCRGKLSAARLTFPQGKQKWVKHFSSLP